MSDYLVVRPVASTDPQVSVLVGEQQAELASRYREERGPVLLHPEWEFLLLQRGSATLGCVALQPVSPGQGEVKRMYVRPAWRGRGLSRLLLAAVERHAATRGLSSLRLETGARQPEAIALYRSNGYREIPAYPPYDEDPLSLCFAKEILPSAGVRPVSLPGDRESDSESDGARTVAS
jgi:putative acetyltransferase